MADDNGAWLLPRIGKAEAVDEVLDAVKYALDNRPTASDAPSTPAGFTEGDLGKLLDFAAAAVNLGALLILFLENRGIGRDHILQLIHTHQRARADLKSLDDGLPFDAG
jgi:hypothetical protein